MTTVLVWSERNEPNAPGFRDCTYASGLMGLLWAGFTAFPKGLYSVEEREALERSDDQPDETGSSIDDLRVAIKRRYGVERATRPVGTLSADLDHELVGMALQGKLSNLPAGHRLRKWQPSFTGGHCVFLYRSLTGIYHWFDPLAPNKSDGDTCTKAEVLQYAIGFGAHMVFNRDELAPVKTYTQAEYDAGIKAATAPLAEQLAKANLVIAKVRAALGQ